MVLDIKNLVPSQTKTMLGRTEKSTKKRLSASDNASDAESSGIDSVEITSQANQINRLVQQMKSEPVLDPDRVSPVMEKLAKGKFDIDFEQVANKMLDFESYYHRY